MEIHTWTGVLNNYALRPSSRQQTNIAPYTDVLVIKATRSVGKQCTLLVSLPCSRLLSVML